jgi:hypothetical protein
VTGAISKSWRWQRKREKHGVEDALRLLLTSARGIQTIAEKEAFEQFLKRCEQVPAISDVLIQEVSLTSFDQLLSSGGVQ